MWILRELRRVSLALGRSRESSNEDGSLEKYTQEMGFPNMGETHERERERERPSIRTSQRDTHTRHTVGAQAAAQRRRWPRFCGTWLEPTPARTPESRWIYISMDIYLTGYTFFFKIHVRTTGADGPIAPARRDRVLSRALFFSRADGRVIRRRRARCSPRRARSTSASNGSIENSLREVFESGWRLSCTRLEGTMERVLESPRRHVAESRWNSRSQIDTCESDAGGLGRGGLRARARGTGRLSGARRRESRSRAA